jgi:hypothetical protein
MGRESSQIRFTCRAIAVIVLASAAGCSSRQLYDSAQGWQRNECHRMQDAAERAQCLSSTATSYDDYKRQSEAAKTSR